MRIGLSRMLSAVVLTACCAVGACSPAESRAETDAEPARIHHTWKALLDRVETLPEERREQYALVEIEVAALQYGINPYPRPKYTEVLGSVKVLEPGPSDRARYFLRTDIRQDASGRIVQRWSSEITAHQLWLRPGDTVLAIVSRPTGPFGATTQAHAWYMDHEWWEVRATAQSMDGQLRVIEEVTFKSTAELAEPTVTGAERSANRLPSRPFAAEAFVSRARLRVQQVAIKEEQR